MPSAAPSWSIDLPRLTDLLSLQRAASRLFSDSTDLEALLPELLPLIAGGVEAQYAALWLVSPATNQLRLAGAWEASEVALANFAAAGRSRPLALGEGAPGRTWESGRASWIEDVLEEPELARREAAAKAGLKTGVCVPVPSVDGVLGVLECLYREARPRDEPVEDALAATASSLGLFMARIAAEDVQRASEQHLELAMGASQMGSWQWDLASEAVTWSESLAAVYGVDRASFGGRFEDFLALVHPDDREYVADVIQRAAAERTALHYEHRIQHPQRGVRWLECRGQVVLDARGQLAGMRGVALDVTARREDEASLAWRAQQQRAVAEAGRRALAGGDLGDILDHIVELTASTLDVEFAMLVEVLDGEATVRASWGWSSEEIGAATIDAQPGSLVRYALDTDEPIIVEQLPADSRFSAPSLLLDAGVVSSVNAIVRRTSGGAWGVLGVHTRESRTFSSDDVYFTRGMANVMAAAIQRQRVEDDQRFLTEASAILGSSLDYEQTLASVARLALPVLGDWCVVYLADTQGMIRQLEVAHTDPAMLERARLLQQRDVDDNPNSSQILAVLRTGRPRLFSELTDEMLVASARDDEHLELLRSVGMTSAMLLPLTARGRTFGAIAFVTSGARRLRQTDIGLAQQLAERAGLAVDNANLYREAREAVRLREEFVSIASHELRSPLTSVLGFAGRLARRTASGALQLDDSTQSEIQTLYAEAQRMRSTLELFLDLAGLDVDQFPVDDEPVDLSQLLGDQVVALRQRFPHAQVDERYAESLVVNTDAGRLSQIVANLLDNAVKYGGELPRVEVGVALEDGGTRACITVRDHGDGIPEEDQPHIFERFYRGAQARATARTRGLGLGLYISREIAERLGAALTVESVPGDGTTFRIALPARGAPPRRGRPAALEAGE